MKTPGSRKKILSTNLFPVVGIGASAGGLEAFKRFLKAIPLDSGLAYVLVQHLDPKHKSILPSLLRQVTKIPVLEITDEIKVEPDHIYIIPSNKTLVANDGVLELNKRPEKGVRHFPIDLFFTSLAEVHQSHAIGVVLSGNATDGTLGLKAIRDKGGLTFAQDSPSAANEGMPHSAAAAGVVDFIMPPEKMPAKLLELKQHLHKMDNEELEEAGNIETYKKILSILQKRKGTDFTHYKESTIRRRIARRMLLHHEGEPRNYLDYLEEQPLEQDALYQDLLIPVTSFFRDPAVFAKLCHSVFPHLLQHKPPEQPIRIWIAGCSTGQEAYSMAMCLEEFLGEQEEQLQIFATDISEPAIAKARKGLYSEGDIKGLSAERLQRFFTKTKGGYQVVKELRDKCVFAVHDFLKDAPFGKLDFVSCRNVLIYMSPLLQKKALTTFHYGLNPGGLLLLGKSETVSSVPELFTAIDKMDKLFSRKEAASHFSHKRSSLHQPNAAAKKKVSRMKLTDNDIEATVNAVLLAGHMPAGVVVNEALDVVLFRGSTGNYLEARSGKPSHSLLKLAKDGLAFELRNLLQKVKKEGVPICKERIPLVVSGNRHMISIEALPLPDLAEPYFLVLFRDQGPAITAGSGLLKGRMSGGVQKDINEQHIVQLEKELAQFREDMRSVTADQDLINEELESANEELLSGNEELQSLNEELETSKEELESTNDELTSLNEQVNAARQYAESIVETICEPVVVLDKELRVKTANQAFYTMFRVVKEQTEGFPIYDLANKQWDIPALRTLLEDIMPRQSSFTGFEVRHHFQTIGERVMLLNALEMKRSKDEEKLILLAIEDITESAQRLMKKKELLTRFQNLVMQAPVAMCILKGEEHVVEVANEYYLNLIDKDQDFVDKPLFESLPELQTQGIQEVLDGVWKSGTPYYGFEQEVWIKRNGIRELRYFNFVYQPMRELDQTVTGIIVVVAEVTEQVVARKRMEAQATMVNNLMMTAPGFVCTLVGPDHVYNLVNERYQSLFGKRQIKGKPILVALPELVGQGFDQLLDKVYETGEPYLGIDIPIKLARDENMVLEERFFNFSYQPMYDDNKNIFSILVFGYEVTEQVLAKNKVLDLQRKHAALLEEQVEQRTTELSDANKALLEKNEELVKANLELESFNYISSHDLQEPLRKIMTYVSLLQDSEAAHLSEKGKSYFATIQESATRMRSLISDLMTYSVTDVKDRKFVLTDMRQLLNDVKTELAPELLKSGAVLDIHPLCPLAVNVSQFRQVFINLISNAIKFSAGAPPRIKISSKQVQWQELEDEVPPVVLGILSHKEAYCRIQIEDNGIGFDPKFRDKIFEVFQRLHNKEKFPGTGIGLAIVKKIVEHHGGFITADSRVGEGSTFSIYLPNKDNHQATR